MFPSSTGNTLLHKLDARTKMLVLTLFSAFVLSEASFLTYFLCLCTLITTIGLLKTPTREFLSLFRIMRYIIMFTFAMHLLFTPAPDETRFIFFHISKKGAINGLLYSLRMVLLVVSAFIFSHTTTPLAVADTLEKLFKPLKMFNISPRDFAMVTLLALRYVPTTIDDAQKLRWAQLSRGGIADKKNFVAKIKNLLPLVVPLFVVAFRRADKLAIALELRGYDSKAMRISLDEIRMSYLDYIIIFISIICFAVYLFIRL